MVTRRTFITSAVAGVLAPVLPTFSSSQATAEVPRVVAKPLLDASLNVIVEKIRQSFASFVLFEEQSAIPPQWSKFFDVWTEYDELRTLVAHDLCAFFEHKAFKEAQRRNESILDHEGRMRIGFQFLFADHFPVLPDRSDEELFEAYLAHAPKSLL